MSTETGHWRAPAPFNWRRFATHAAAATIASVTTAATMFAITVSDPAPAPAPTATSSAHPLSTLEAAGIDSLLDHQHGSAHKASGTITVGAHTLGIGLSYVDDGTTGSGVITAGGTRGDTLLDQGVVYLRGNQDFWAALGVTGPPPPGWVNAGPEFLEGKIFYPATKWSQALAPSPQARLDGDVYTAGPNSAKIGAKGITHYSVDSVDVDLAPATAADVIAAATQLGADHGPGVPVKRSSTGWAFTPPPTPAAAPPTLTPAETP